MIKTRYSLASEARKIREHQGLTLQELSEASGVPTSTISRIERGGNVTILPVLLVANAMNVRVEDVISVIGGKAIQPGDVEIKKEAVFDSTDF